MSLFNLPVDEFKKNKPTSVHPWSKTIKDEYSPHIRLSHNSVKNVRYPKPKKKILSSKQISFTLLGNRVTKEFIYCVHLVEAMHRYRSKKFAPPVIRAVTGVEWESNTLRYLQIQYGALAHCLQSQVAVIRNGELIGGEKELRELIETEYYINMLALDYQRESIKQFAKYLKEIRRPVAYMHITINEKPIGSLMFMLYSDIVPRTCENFLRLCEAKKGGYNGTPVHRIVKDGWIQCGGFALKNTDMDCENFIVNFDRRGVLGMANAGRHSDCSTQFFVLLQPNACLKLRFVAFGQLIDGEETLKKIEAVETYYEAPLDNIMIFRSGIVNLQCKNIRINKNAREYIDKHIDDLVIIGEIFYAMLLENVFLEAELRELAKLEPPMPEGEFDAEENLAFQETVDDHGQYIPENIRATRRFIRKKEELENEKDNKELKQKASIPQPSKAVYQASKVIKKPDDKLFQFPTKEKSEANIYEIPPKAESGPENVEFDVEDYQPEEYSYSQVSISTKPKPTKPYYLALTDVPYPGETSSTFDLKRFLQGDYCLESDLNPNSVAKAYYARAHQKWKQNQKIEAVCQIISSYGGSKWNINSSSSSSSSSEELDSDEEREIKEYLQEYGEKASFSGNVVKKISKNYVTNNPVEDKGSREFWNDEELRRMRMAVQDIKSRARKKVSISVQPWETHNKIKRRMTGYVKNQTSDELEDEDDEDKQKSLSISGDPRKGSVSITAPHKTSQHKIKRRQTGFDPPAQYLSRTKVDREGEEEQEDGDVKDFKQARVPGLSALKSGVRIAPKEMNTQEYVGPMMSRKSILGDRPEIAMDKSRPSVLMRLYDDIAVDDTQGPPTLKDYKPVTTAHKKTFTLAEDLADNYLTRGSINVFQQQLARRSSTTTESPEGRRSSEKRGISADYSTRWNEVFSINSVEYSRKRPSISVAQYQQKIRMEMEALAKNFKEEEAKKIPKEVEDSEFKSTRTGIRLPGDSPAYDTQMSDRNLKSQEPLRRQDIGERIRKALQ